MGTLYLPFISLHYFSPWGIVPPSPLTPFLDSLSDNSRFVPFILGPVFLPPTIDSLFDFIQNGIRPLHQALAHGSISSSCPFQAPDQAVKLVSLFYLISEITNCF